MSGNNAELEFDMDVTEELRVKVEMRDGAENNRGDEERKQADEQSEGCMGVREESREDDKVNACVP